jgi:transcriptional regulator with XRE-family HTH domain
MHLTNRRLLAKLLAIQGVSQRELAEAAGWKSHSYLGRLLRGEVTTLEPEPAVRIARFLGVGVDDLFMVKTSSGVEQTARRREAVPA